GTQNCRLLPQSVEAICQRGDGVRPRRGGRTHTARRKFHDRPDIGGSRRYGTSEIVFVLSMTKLFTFKQGNHIKPCKPNKQDKKDLFAYFVANGYSKNTNEE